MKTAVFILLGYITCPLMCAVNKKEAENRTEKARKSDTLVRSGNIEEAVGAEQLGHVMIIDATKPPHNLDQPEDVVTTDAVVPSNYTEQPEHLKITDAVEPPDDTRQPQDSDITEYSYHKPSSAYEVSIHDLDWSNTTLPVDTEQADYRDDEHPVNPPDDTKQPDYIDNNTEQPGYKETIVKVKPTDETNQPEYIDNTEETSGANTMTSQVMTLPVDTDQLNNLDTSSKVPEDEDVKLTQLVNIDTTAAALNTKDTVNGDATAEPTTQTTKTPELKTTDTGPATIKVEDALKILEKSKNKYAKASIALIHRLEWLRSTYNVTELVIDHKVDVHEFDKTYISAKSPKIMRMNFEDGFTYLKNAIMNVTTKFDISLMKSALLKI